jgi:hypothetical protein
MHRPGIRRDLALFCGLAALLLAVLFRDALLHGHVLGQGDVLFRFVPWAGYRPTGWRIGNPLLADVPEVFYPFLAHARTAVWNATFPLWNSAAGAGQPFFASFQSAVLSPFSAIAYVLPLPGGLTVAIAARLLAGGAGMFCFLRALPLSTPAAAFGGVAYLLNPFSIVWLEHPLAAVAAWLPWLLASVDACARRPGARSAGLVAIAVALTLLSGHPETAFKIFLLTGAYALYRGADAGRAWQTAALVAGGGAVGALACAIQLLPFFEYAGGSRVLAMRAAAGQPLFTNPPASFVTTFVPDFYGTPIGRAFVIGGNYCEQQVYPGIVAWALAALAPFHRTHRRTALFFVVAGALAALVMYNLFGAARLATLVMPPLRVAALSRFGLLLIAGVAIAAAIGADVLFDARPEESGRGVLARGAAVTAAALVIGTVVVLFFREQRQILVDGRQWIHAVRAAAFGAQLLAAAVALVWVFPFVLRQAAIAIAIALLAVDLLSFADGFHPLTPPAHLYPQVEEIARIQQDRSLFRVAGWQDALVPNTAMMYGLQDFRSYDGVGVTAYAELLDAGFRFEGGAHRLVGAGALPLLDLLNVKYVVAPADVDLPADRFARVHDGRSRVYENLRVLPRAFLADRVVPLRGAEALRALRDGDLDVSRTAIVEEALQSTRQPEAAAGPPGTAAVRSYADTAVTIETRADGRRLLVLSDVHYPGWTARVDGNAAPIERVNYAFRGVVVPAGTHVVEFRYEPASVRAGALLSLIGAGLAGWLLSRRATARPSR